MQVSQKTKLACENRSDKTHVGHPWFWQVHLPQSTSNLARDAPYYILTSSEACVFYRTRRIPAVCIRRGMRGILWSRMFRRHLPGEKSSRSWKGTSSCLQRWRSDDNAVWECGTQSRITLFGDGNEKAYGGRKSMVPTDLIRTDLAQERANTCTDETIKCTFQAIRRYYRL